MDLPSKNGNKITSERKRKLDSNNVQEKKVCVDNFSWWTNMMLGVHQGQHVQIPAVTSKKLPWK